MNIIEKAICNTTLTIFEIEKIGILSRKDNSLSFPSFISSFNKLAKENDFIFGIWPFQFVKENADMFISYLSENELLLYNRCKSSKKRQIEILGTRVLAKLLIRKIQVIQNEKEIEVLRNIDNSPIIFIKGKKENSLNISISHKDDYIFIAISLNTIGIDIERKTAKLEKVKRIFCSNEEGKLIKIDYAHLWSSKEAISKYLKKNILHTLKNTTLIKSKGNILSFSYKNETIINSYNLTYSDYIFSIVF